MSNAKTRITIGVDCANPGQYFACCGLLEMADRLWPGAEGCFRLEEPRSSFNITAAAAGASLGELLGTARALEFEFGGDQDEDDEHAGPIVPIIITAPFRLVLDWWSEKSIKPWAGSMDAPAILGAMLRAIDTASPDPLNQAVVARDPSSGKKREPFYFDCRRGSNAHPLDSGFSPDVQGLESYCYPAVEAMCFLGLQRARPARTDRPNRSRYVVWTEPLPVNALAPVTSGLASIDGCFAMIFDNFFRTDQRKHKSFSRAMRERSKDV